MFGLLSFLGILHSWRTVGLEVSKVMAAPVRESQLRHCLLLLLALVYGLELGFKLSQGKVLLLLNPCHMLTLIQMFLLVSPSTRFTNTVFRLHVYWLTGKTGNTQLKQHLSPPKALSWLSSSLTLSTV